jgi:monovalent cation:H+ antiporter, CPA1 family
MTEIIMGQLLFLGCAVLLGQILGRLVHIDDTLSCLVAGVLAGLALPYLKIDTGIRAGNIQDIVFYIVLPVLIFEAAWHLSPGLLRRWLGPILLLSTLGVLISTGLMAGLLYLGIGHSEGFPWGSALLAGAILAATDPISVVATLKRNHAAGDLTTLIEGESLFNDATSVVLFVTILAWVTGEGGNVSVIGHFLRVFAGGLALGCVMGAVGALLVHLAARRTSANIALILLAFASFYVGESLLHVSGIMTIVACAITARALFESKVFGKQQHDSLSGIADTWDWLGSLFNGILFVLMGLTITFEMFSAQWLAMLIAIGAALIARAGAVFICGGISHAMPRPVPLKWQAIQFWGGLRGAIAIALALSLPTEVEAWWTVQSMVFGVVLFTLLLQGTSCGSLIKKYGLPSRPTA